MSASVHISAERTRSLEEAPGFGGLVRAELFKIRHMASARIGFMLTLCFVAMPNIWLMLVPNFTDHFALGKPAVSLVTFYTLFSLDFLIVRVFIGFFLIILTANVIGLEYQLGTIRILLARGIGRVQLLLAKVCAVALFALFTLLCLLLLVAIMMLLTPLIKAGDLNVLQTLTGDFWHNVGLYLLTILMSVGATILMTASMCAISRSLAMGLTVASLWFPVDNVGVKIMGLVYKITGNSFWLTITAYFLGPNLNQMPSVVIPATYPITNEGFFPLVKVSGIHTLLVVLVYAILFATSALVLTWKRDVKE